MKNITVILIIVLATALSGSLYANVRLTSVIHMLKNESNVIRNQLNRTKTSSDSDKLRLSQLEQTVQSSNSTIRVLQNDITAFSMQARLCAYPHTIN